MIRFAIGSTPKSAAVGPPALSHPRTQEDQLTQKDLLVFLLLLGELFRIKVVHFNELNLVGVGQWWIDALTIYKLTQLGKDGHVFRAEEIIDQCFSCVSVGRLVAEA